MSHVATVEMAVKDLSALEVASKKLGLLFQRGKETWRSFDSQTNRSTHAISVPNSSYDIGVIKTNTGFELKMDEFGSQARVIHERLGMGLAKLKSEYTATVTTKQLQRQGYRVQRTMQDGRIQLVGVKS